MMQIYITVLSCVLYIIVNVLYVKYVSIKNVNMRELIYNTALMGLCIYGSFEILNIIPLNTINRQLTGGSGTGKGGLVVFTNDPSF
jgi:hypothetical protein